jgi:hypothetical protein
MPASGRTMPCQMSDVGLVSRQRAQQGLGPWLWGAVVRAPGVGAEVGELQYTAAPQVGGSGGVLG